LDDAIQAVTNTVVLSCQVTGLARLPDDLLAYIFETCLILEQEEEEDTNSPYVLASVCKRFRRVAVRLPILWKNVSSDFSAERLSAHTTRCRNPNVFLNASDPVLDVLDRIHPCPQWEELHIQYLNEDDGHRFFHSFGPRVQSHFDAVKYLSVCNRGVRNEDEEPSRPTPGSILEVDELQLASWRMPNLTGLKLQNIIPSVFIPCSNVTCFTLVLEMISTEFTTWDLLLLRNFLQLMPRIINLSITFEGIASFYNISADPLALPCLRSLDMSLQQGPTSESTSPSIGQFLDLVDTSNLTKLHIVVELYPDDRLVGDWVSAFFAHPAHQRSCIRSFPKVEEFSLNIYSLEQLEHPPFCQMFAALPNIQVLSLILPEYLKLDLVEWSEIYGGLHELRSVYINECDHLIHRPIQYSNFFYKLSKLDQWKKFELLEVLCSSDLSDERERLENFVGGKLDWKA